MAKMTLLKFVQKIGQAINSDEIDSIDETVESQDILGILEDTYREILDRRTWEFMKDRVMPMAARLAGDTKINNLMIPSSVVDLQCVKYLGANGKFVELEYVQPCEFMDRAHARNAGDSNVTAIVNANGIALNTFTDRPPTYYTSFDEEYLTYDAYDSTRGVGNIVADSVIIATIKPTMDFTNPAALFPIPERMESLLLNEAIATANYRLRQTADPRSERLARRQNIDMRLLEPRTGVDTQEVNYGRKSRSGR